MKRTKIKAFTLNEILVVMVLTAIVSFIAFEGLSLYQRMYGYVVLHNNQSMEMYDNYSRTQGLFCSADSIFEEDGYLKIYRGNECMGSFKVCDSLMTFKPGNSLILDTLFTQVSEYEIKVYDNASKRHIDSLFIVSDNVLLKFGVCVRPERSALSDIIMSEIKNENYENR